MHKISLKSHFLLLMVAHYNNRAPTTTRQLTSFQLTSPKMTFPSTGTLPYASQGVLNSVTRLGDLLHFGQLFKACGNNYFARISHILRQFL